MTLTKFGGDTEDSEPTRLWRVRQVDGVTVLTPNGVFDDAVVAWLDHLTESAPSAVVIDLGECTLHGTEHLDLLDPVRWRFEQHDVCIACPRLSARSLLRRAGVHHRLAVFFSVRDALQARVLVASGFGTGWSVR